MIGVDNVRFWSATPGIFLNKMTGENILESQGISGPLFSGQPEEWNQTLVELICDIFNGIEILSEAKIEILCSERINNILKCSDTYNDDHLIIPLKSEDGDLTSLKFLLKVVSVEEPRIDVFLDGTYAGVVIVKD